MFLCFLENIENCPHSHKCVLNVPVEEMPNCSPESTLIPIALKRFAYVPIIETASPIVPRNRWEALNFSPSVMQFSCPFLPRSGSICNSVLKYHAREAWCLEKSATFDKK